MNQAGKPELSEHLSRARRDNYRKVAISYMMRNVQEIADRAGGSILRHYPGGGIHSVFLNGYEDGFARAVELIISGKLQLKEAEVMIPKPEQPSERAL